MKIHFLGVTGFPASGNQTIALLVENKGSQILIDCGASVISQMDSISGYITDLDGICVTHIHADHASGIPLVFFANAMERFYSRNRSGKNSLTLAMEQVTYDNYLPLAKSAYPLFFGDKSPLNLSLNSLPNNEPSSFTVNDCSITTFPVQHSVPTIGCLLTWDGHSVCYTSDTKYFDGLASQIKSAEVLVCNIFGPTSLNETAQRFGFMTANEAAQLANQIGAKILVLQHLFFYERDVELCRDEAAKIFSGKILVPKDCEVITI